MGDKDHAVTGLYEDLSVVVQFESSRTLGEVIVHPTHPKFVTSRSYLCLLTITNEAAGSHFCADLPICEIPYVGICNIHRSFSSRQNRTNRLLAKMAGLLPMAGFPPV